MTARSRPDGQLVREVHDDLFGRSEAVFSADRRYRYLLTRQVAASGPVMTVVMLNPSTATASTSDQTIAKCFGYACRENCGRLVVVNLFAWQATDPAELRHAADPVGPRNDEFIAGHCEPGGLVVAAWGAHGHLLGRGPDVAARLAAAGVALSCLGTTRSGQPRHPCRTGYSLPLVPYRGSAR
jgi:hypothetical protein